MNTGKLCPQCGRAYEEHQRFCTEDGAALVAPAAGAGDLVGSVVAERYHVIKKLGEGGMGQVYLAEHVRMGRMSALKVLRPGTVHDADAIARFNREASNASRVNHTNVASIYDFGETRDGLIFLAMEYVDGEPLSRTIERGGALPPARVATIVSQVAAGLGAAHGLGIVHRDLKPDNIMVGVDADGADRVKLVDFGIAKVMQAAEQHVTATGLVIGTPAYMSPEQLTGQPIDARTDIYALGIVTFNMLTGTLPFTATSVHGELLARLTERPRTLAEAHPEVPWPPALQSVLDRALAREPAERYGKATELGRDLLVAVESTPDIAGAATAISASLLVPKPRVPTTLRPPPRTSPTQLPAGTSAPAAAPETVPAARDDGGASGRRRLIIAGSVVPALALAAVAFVMFGPARRGEPPPGRDSTASPAVTPPVAGTVTSPSAAGDSVPASSRPAVIAAVDSPRASATQAARPPANAPSRAPASARPGTGSTRAPADTPQVSRYAQPQPPGQVVRAVPVDSGPRASSGGAAVAAKSEPAAPSPPEPNPAEEARLVETLAADVAAEFTRAFGQRTFAQAGRVAQALPSRTRDGFAQLLADRDNSNFSAAVDGRPAPVVTGSTAVAPITLSVAFRNRSAGMMRQSLSYVATFRREASGWQLVTLTPK